MMGDSSCRHTCIVLHTCRHVNLDDDRSCYGLDSALKQVIIIHVQALSLSYCLQMQTKNP